jgi:hypothetical protein
MTQDQINTKITELDAWLSNNPNDPNYNAVLNDKKVLQLTLQNMETSKNAFCKLFEVDGYQVLYRLHINTENDNEVELVISTFIDGVELSSKLSGFEDSTAEKALESVGAEQALKFFEAMKALVSDPNEIEINNPEIVE